MFQLYRGAVKPWKKAAARRLRRNQTPAEDQLWQHLRLKRLEAMRWRRQIVILGYIVDFYCPKARLVVELDGGYHEHRQRWDRQRDKAITALGVEILRFPNEVVFSDLKRSLAKIADRALDRASGFAMNRKRKFARYVS